MTRPPLWAPWRMEYVGAPKGDGCIFCSPGDDDRRALILDRRDHVLVMLNRYPYCAGHLMVAPDVHAARLYDLEPPLRDALWQRVGQASRILDDLLECDGQNVGVNVGTAGGAGFAGHIHVHLVPRWNGDTNFMTAAADIRVIPEHLDRTWQKLRPHFEALS